MEVWFREGARQTYVKGVYHGRNICAARVSKSQTAIEVRFVLGVRREDRSTIVSGD